MSAPGRLRGATQSLAGAALLITVVTIASRLLGFARQFVQAHEVGTAGVGTAYASANLLPNILYEVAAGGALAGAVVPILAGAIARRARLDVNRSASALLTWALLVLVPLAVVVLVLAGPITSLIPNVGHGETAATTAYFLRVFALQIPLYGVGFVLSGVLQAHKRFFWPAAVPMLSSVVVIGAYLVFGHLDPDPTDVGAASRSALAWLAWGTTAGVAAMSLPLFVPAWRTGTSLRLTLRFPPGQAARARRLALAGVGAVVAQQVASLAILWAANRWGGDGAFPVYQYAQAVYVLPYAVLAVPLATSTFPRLAERASLGDHAGFSRLVATTTRIVLTVTAVGVAALVAASDAVQSLFDTFTPGGVAGMAATVAWLAPGLLGFALVFHLSRVLYSLDHGRAAVRATALGWGVVVVASLVLPPLLVRHASDPVRTLEGVGAATSLGMTVAGAALLWAVHRYAPGRPLVGLARTVVALVVGAALGAVAGLLTSDLLLPDDAGWLAALGVGALAAGVGAAVVVVVSVLGDRPTLRGLASLRRSDPAPVPGGVAAKGPADPTSDDTREDA